MSKRISGRKVKSILKDILINDNWKQEASSLILDPDSSSIEALIANLYSTEPLIKWRSITMIGLLAKEIYKSKPEKVRILMRRFIWMLTEECGGIAWGAPEAMGEIAANIPDIAEEYAHLIFAYINEVEGPDNFLEYEPLREGVFWGIMQLSEMQPAIVNNYRDIIIQRMQSESNSYIAAVQCLIAKNINNVKDFNDAKSFLIKNITNNDIIQLYFDEEIIYKEVSYFAQSSLNYYRNNNNIIYDKL